jgi:16S rRNA processing protein RimM
MPAETPKYLLLGEVLRPHGIRGELRVRLLTDYPERINDLDEVFIGVGVEDENPTVYAVEHMRMNPPYGLLKLEGVKDREGADLLRSLFVMVDIENAVPLEEGEFYLYQLIGLAVKLEDGTPLGTLTEVLETGANDVYVVDSPQYKEVLIPVTDETIVRTDIDAGELIVRLPDGLLPE